MKHTTLSLTVLVLLLALHACDLRRTETAPEYFKAPLPISPVTKTEKQDFVADTLLRGLENPWSIAFLPTGEVLITERPGRIRIVKDGVLLEQDIEGVPEVYVNGQGGLHEIKLHPDFADNGMLYLAYASPGEGGGNTAVCRARLDGYKLVEVEEIFQALPYSEGTVHFGGRIEFDRKGYMYVSTGDRGAMHNAQSLENHNGKIHRLHMDGTVPTDNPFFETEGAVKSIFSYGHRNPQGMDLHPETGEIWLHEHAPRGGDELNISRFGLNYGWPAITFGINYDSTVITPDTARVGMEQPLTYWNPSIAPCGMTFVTSDKYPNWKGNLLVGSLRYRYVARLELAGEKVTHEESLLAGAGRVRAIEQGPDGYLYVATEDPGLLIRLFPVEDLGR
jgi:aldose sugar dehydrogenase